MFAMFILTFALGIALGTATILVRQIKIMREIGYSAVAFFAADSGIEKVLFKDRYDPTSVPDGYEEVDIPLGNGAEYTVSVTKDSDGTTIKSEGTYQNTKRVVEIQY